jgi:hypothetical protein
MRVLGRLHPGVREDREAFQSVLALAQRLPRGTLGPAFLRACGAWARAEPRKRSRSRSNSS